MLRHTSSGPMSRRDAMGLLAAGAGIGLIPGVRDNAVLALGQPGGWHAAASGAKPSFPQGSFIRTALKDMAPDELGSGSVQIHEHLGGQFTPTPPPPAGSDMLPGVVAPRNEAEYLDLMVDELKMSRAEG